MAAKIDVYTRVTNQIVQALENGVRPWHKPWNAEHAAGKITRPLRGNGEAYQGINVLMLWSEAVDRGYAAPIWMTFRQAKELNANVRKGEKGTQIVYANKLTVTETDESTGEDKERKIPFMKAYTVFNVEQIDHLPAHFYATTDPKIDPSERDVTAETFIAATRANIQYGGNRASYSVSDDKVRMPRFEFFESPESYYATLIHELTHWTRHPHRLDRDFGRKRWGDAGYAMEELVAELGAAFLSADLALTPEVGEDHVAYLEHWLTVLKNDKRAIFTAAAHAQRAVDHLHDLQPALEAHPDPYEEPVEEPAVAAYAEDIPASEDQQLTFDLE